MARFTAACRLLLLLAVASAAPRDQRFAWMSDAEGALRLVDLRERVGNEVGDPETDPAPLAITENDFTLHLYTRGNAAGEVLRRGDSASGPSFNGAHPTRIVVHGWTANYQVMADFATAYLAAGDYNVILVDWSGPASSSYLVSVSYMRDVAALLANVVADLRETRNMDLSQLALVGHSLGGQMVGELGKLLDGQVPHVVGLDPAGPYFEGLSASRRLDPSDGRLVQVIHTNGGGLGYEASCGDVDFFVNGGAKQAGCGIIADIAGLCSHVRVLDLFVESIDSKDFVATKCDSDRRFTLGLCKSNPSDVLGEHTAGSEPGDYYLTTNSNSPYAQG